MQLIPITIKAIQEQQEIIDLLEKRIIEIEEKLNKIGSTIKN